MKLPEMTDEAFLKLAREEDNCEVSAGSMQGVFRKKGHPAAETSEPAKKDRFRRSRQPASRKARAGH
jgi:hypothetical protein